MATGYTLPAQLVIVTNIGELPRVFVSIFSKAFGFEEAISGEARACSLTPPSRPPPWSCRRARSWFRPAVQSCRDGQGWPATLRRFGAARCTPSWYARTAYILLFFSMI